MFVYQYIQRVFRRRLLFIFYSVSLTHLHNANKQFVFNMYMIYARIHAHTLHTYVTAYKSEYERKVGSESVSFFLFFFLVSLGCSIGRPKTFLFHLFSSKRIRNLKLRKWEKVAFWKWNRILKYSRAIKCFYDHTVVPGTSNRIFFSLSFYLSLSLSLPLSPLWIKVRQNK